MSVLVSHPGLQHAHQLALALFERELLQAFWSGVPVVNETDDLPRWLPDRIRIKLKSVPIPIEYRHHPIVFPALMTMSLRLPELINREELIHRIFHGYDWWVSKKIKYLKPSIVVAYENSAYHTFKAAKAIGARCILDAASVHHSMGMSLGIVRATPFREFINVRKDAETEMADLILTCSSFAAESYRAAGITPAKLKTVPLGADLPNVEPVSLPHSTSLRFIFAGAIRHLKAIDIIIEVFKRLYSDGLQGEVLFVGGSSEARWLDEIRKMPNATYHPSVPQKQLFQMMAGSDCLLLPSRFDSFGMVVAEAMACGTPAIVSDMTGAKAMIEQFPGSGWIVEPNAESLYRCIRERLENRDELFAAREFALAAARHFTWQAYRQRVGQVVQDFIES